MLLRTVNDRYAAAIPKVPRTALGRFLPVARGISRPDAQGQDAGATGFHRQVSDDEAEAD
jgi:hypothetical protein